MLTPTRLDSQSLKGVSGEIIILGFFRCSNHLVHPKNPSTIAPPRPDTHHRDLLAMLTPNMFEVPLSDCRGGGILRRGTRRRGHRSITQVCFPLIPIVHTQALTVWFLCAQYAIERAPMHLDTPRRRQSLLCVCKSFSKCRSSVSTPAHPCTPLNTEDRHFAYWCGSQDDCIERSRRVSSL